MWIVCHLLLMTNSIATSKLPKLLVFGGNGFLGGETVNELLTLKAFDITLINRGHWDNYDAKYRIRPFVKNISIDR